MSVPALARIERLNLVLAVAATAVGGIVWGGTGMLAAGVGAALACLNFRVIGRIGAQAVAAVAPGPAAEDGAAVLGRLMLRMALKLAVLLAVVWCVLAIFELAVAPFAVGISVFVVSILLAAAGVVPASGFQSEVS